MFKLLKSELQKKFIRFLVICSINPRLTLLLHLNQKCTNILMEGIILAKKEKE